jgi:hypothetical protein
LVEERVELRELENDEVKVQVLENNSQNIEWEASSPGALDLGFS